MFRQELEFFKANQDKLVGQYRGKILVIRGEEVLGAYLSAIEAYCEAMKKFQVGTFMLQPCEPGPQAYTATITSTQVLL